MADEPAPAGGAPAPEAKPAPDPKPAPAAPNASAVKASDLPDAALSARLEQAQRSAETKLLGRFKVASPDEIEAKLKELDELKTAQLSETEKQQKRIAELEPQAQRAAIYKQRLDALVEEQFSTLAESQRAAIDAVANGDAEKRLELMQVMRAAGLVPASPAPANKPPPPANTAPPVNPPKPSGSETAFQQWEALTSPISRQIFYQAHRAEIEASRPA